MEVNEDSYSVNGVTTELNAGDTYNVVYGGGIINPEGSGISNNNNVTINSGTINGLWGGFTPSGNAIGNTLIINGGNISMIIGGLSGGPTEGVVYGSYGDITDNGGHAHRNSIVMNGGTVAAITGGFGGNNANALYNTVEIKGGTVSSTLYGAETYLGEAVYNSVKISGGTISANVGGATSYSGYIANNDVTIEGGTFSQNIIAGFNSSNSATVTDNSINIYNSPVLSTANLYGYFGTPAIHSGNALNIYTKGLTAQNISNFDVINFYLPESTVNGDTILTLSATSTDISGATVNAGVAGNANLNEGDTITLLTNGGTITDTGTTYGTLTEGVSLTYNLTVAKDGDNKIIATIGNSNPSGGDSGDGDSGGGGTSGGGGDSSSGTSSTTTTTTTFNKKTKLFKKFRFVPIEPTLPEPDFDFDSEKIEGFFDSEQKGWEIFANAGAGPMKYKVNNGHIDTTNQNIDVGAARSVGNLANQMTVAPVIDYQNTNYDTYLNDGTHARGNSKYTAGGLVLRNLNRNGFYYETSFRAGRVKTDFASEDLDTTGNFGTVTYDNSATVLNAHLKLGKYLRLDKNNLLNIYGFYYHTHQGGSGADLSSGEHYDFSSSNAGRFRLGYRMTTRTSKISQIYTGLAYQFEHNSGVTASYKNYSVSDGSHNGSSGMLELGWIIKPLKDNPWAVDINTTGWIGNQRGVKAVAKISKSF